MSSQTLKFMKIFSVEMADLLESLSIFVDTMDERHKKHELTEYVWTENRSLLEHEMHLLQLMQRKFDELNSNDFASPGEVKEAILKMLHEREDVPESLIKLVTAKIEKVETYLSF